MSTREETVAAKTAQQRHLAPPRSLPAPRLEHLAAALSPIAALLLWQALVGWGVLDHRFFPLPTQVLRALWSLIRSGRLWHETSITLYRVGWGFASGAAGGIACGLIMGVSRLVRAFLDPIISALYVIPKIAVLPLVMLIVGIGDASKVAIVAIGVFFVVVINTTAAVLAIDPIYIEAGRNFGANRLQMFRHVILPGALPSIFTGLRIAAGIALITVIAAEFVEANRGLGYLIWQSWQTLVVENMYAGLVVVGALGVAFAALIAVAARLAMPWQRRGN